MAVKKALIVIDMQNDYLWEKRKAKFCYDTKQLTENVNDVVHKFSEQGGDVIYIEQLFPNLPTNRLFIGFSIKGTEGAQLYGGLDIVSRLRFEKKLPDSYSSKKFREFMREQAYDEVYVCGLDLCGCVGATAKGAVKTGAKVFLVQQATGSRYAGEKQQKMKSALAAAGVGFV